MNHKRKGIEWLLKHIHKAQMTGDKPIDTYNHINLRDIKKQGYRVINETPNYILLARGMAWRDVITYTKKTHSVERQHE